MIRVSSILVLTLVFPFLCVALGWRSWPLALVFFLLALSTVAFFFTKAHSIFLSSIRAEPAAEHSLLSRTFHRLLQKHGKNLNVMIWLVPGPQRELQIWSHFSGRLDFYFSQVGLAQVSEQELEQIILQSYDFPKIRATNQLYALSLILTRLKGPFGRFRYWQASFWLYPLERLLGIAKI